MTHRRSTDAAGTLTDPAASARDFERETLPHLNDVARFARALARDRTLADDLVQQTYLLALRGWHSFRPGSDARRWLCTICHHTFLRTVRREARYVAAPDADPELESLATATAHARAQRSGALGEVERMERADLGAALDAALATLPPYYRAAVVLVDVEGHGYEYAAAVLGVAVGTVRSRLFRGRRLLQDQLFAYALDAGFDVSRSRSPSARPDRAPPRRR